MIGMGWRRRIVLAADVDDGKRTQAAFVAAAIVIAAIGSASPAYAVADRPSGVIRPGGSGTMVGSACRRPLKAGCRNRPLNAGGVHVFVLCGIPFVQRPTGLS